MKTIFALLPLFSLAGFFTPGLDVHAAISTQEHTTTPAHNLVAFEPTATAYVFAPTSNIRDYPNGPILCKVYNKVYITVYTDTVTNGWYETYFCGTKGWIHSSQIRF